MYTDYIKTRIKSIDKQNVTPAKAGSDYEGQKPFVVRSFFDGYNIRRAGKRTVPAAGDAIIN